ncbi:AraC family transcriptional regulator [Formosa sp. 4Alg 33]|uniref:AraC family transcriptional regulator n=1 Tax=Formosa sp. 4Alg 33 TaxID=3382189 RepID=UPI003D9C3EFB
MSAVIGFKVPMCQDSSIRVEEYVDTQFYNTIHFHEEYQITLILDGDGSLAVGEKVCKFKSGEFYLFGKNLPHAFRNDGTKVEETNKIKAHYISVFFNVDSYGFLLNENQETKGIKELLSQALYGLVLGNVDAHYLEDKMRMLATLSEFDQVLELLTILDHISTATGHKKLINNKIESLDYDVNTIDEINEVFEFIKCNYKKKISLETIAGHFNMTSATFGRFFKLRTQKTFSQYLIETRILKACELIRSGSHNTTESCYNSGFTNISNFHRHFKKVIGMTPTQYKLSIEKNKVN